MALKKLTSTGLCLVLFLLIVENTHVNAQDEGPISIDIGNPSIRQIMGKRSANETTEDAGGIVSAEQDAANASRVKRDGLIVARGKRALCGMQCSSGSGDCVEAAGYTGSFCCSDGYSFHCGTSAAADNDDDESMMEATYQMSTWMEK